MIHILNQTTNKYYDFYGILIRSYINTVFTLYHPFPFLSKSLPYPYYVLSNAWLLISITTNTSMNIAECEHLALLLCLFGAQHLGLGTISGALSLEKTNSPSLRRWPVALHLGWVLVRSPIHLGMLLVPVQFRRPHFWDFIDVTFILYIESTPLQMFCLLALMSSSPLQQSFLSLWHRGCVVDVPTGAGHHSHVLYILTSCRLM